MKLHKLSSVLGEEKFERVNGEEVINQDLNGEAVTYTAGGGGGGQTWDGCGPGTKRSAVFPYHSSLPHIHILTHS